MQDWTLLAGKEMDGYTIIKMSRPLKTCDEENDIEIKKETNYLIFAWNPSDPVNNNWKYHDKNRRVRVLMLLGYRDPTENAFTELRKSEDTVQVEVKLDKVWFCSSFFLVHIITLFIFLFDSAFD